MGIFDFLTTEHRRIKRTANDLFVVDTAYVGDSKKPYETAVSSMLYKDGEYIIVETYDTEEDSLEGHDKWVDVMSQPTDKLPEELADVGTSEIALMIQDLDAKSLIYKKTTDETKLDENRKIWYNFLTEKKE